MPQSEPSAADPNVALILANGDEVLRDGKIRKRQLVPQPAARFSQEIESGRKAAATLSRIHRKLGDLPDIPEKMNPIAAILLYHAIGLSDEDIAQALGASEDQIQRLKSSELYAQLFDLFDKSVFEDTKRNARHIIAKASDKAATRIVEALDSDAVGIRLKAAEHITRLGGISLEQENNRLPGGLKIVVEKADGSNNDRIVVTVGEDHGPRS